MKHVYKAFYGALLVLGLAGIFPEPALAADGTHWDTVCNCRRPDSEYHTRRYVREAPRVVTHERVVNRTRVVRGNTKLIQENRLVVHVRPVINREVVVHRTNTIVRDVDAAPGQHDLQAARRATPTRWSTAMCGARCAMCSSGTRFAA